MPTLVIDIGYIIPAVFERLNSEENSNPDKNFIICQGVEICKFVEDFLLYYDGNPKIAAVVTLGYITEAADDIPDIEFLSLVGEYDGLG